MLKSLLFASLVAVSGLAQAQSDARYSDSNGDTTPGSGAMAVDIALARPLGLVATVLGTAVFVAALPFEAISGNIKGPAKRLVVEPAKYTFTRPLGEGN